ncbi:hypothetical protein Poly30_24160 [Planctomycetes bacterium Poly30]|uniref:Lipoprotein n=1 Tax=Saltatorellus ferox TaxID=2528018 RepID=A0A518ES29_9BACT|nr:hypothetical protein Poly30_24160 [Planctomycetes bacterium Poly30]
MRLTIAAVAATCAALLASCQFSGNKINDHWNFDSVSPRATRILTGYDASKESSYKDFAWNRKKANGLTFRRYFMNHNPLNPNQEPVKSYYEPRPVNSILPNPWNYIHFEGLVIGGAIAGGFPVPVDSIIGTFERGGIDEFKAGIRSAFDNKGVITSADARTFYGEDGELPPFEMSKGK